MALTQADIDTIVLALQYARTQNDSTAPVTDVQWLQYSITTNAQKRTTVTGWLNTYRAYAQTFVDGAQGVAAATTALYSGVVTACSTAITDLP